MKHRIPVLRDTATVDCVRLDSIVTDTGKRIAVKIDVEGYELTVIHGMKERPIHRIGDDHYFTNRPA